MERRLKEKGRRAASQRSRTRERDREAMLRVKEQREVVVYREGVLPYVPERRLHERKREVMLYAERQMECVLQQ